MTKGGPVNATNIMIYNLYTDVFKNYKSGLATAQSIMLFIIAFPLIFALIKSTQTISEIFTHPPKMTFGSGFFDNYFAVWNNYNLKQYILNTAFIALVITGGNHSLYYGRSIDCLLVFIILQQQIIQGFSLGNEK